jgi:hypothetical protein
LNLPQLLVLRGNWLLLATSTWTCQRHSLYLPFLINLHSGTLSQLHFKLGCTINVNFLGMCIGQRANVEYPQYPHSVPSYLWASSQLENYSIHQEIICAWELTHELDMSTSAFQWWPVINCQQWLECNGGYLKIWDRELCGTDLFVLYIKYCISFIFLEGGEGGVIIYHVVVLDASCFIFSFGCPEKDKEVWDGYSKFSRMRDQCLGKFVTGYRCCWYRYSQSD